MASSSSSSFRLSASARPFISARHHYSETDTHCHSFSSASGLLTQTSVSLPHHHHSFTTTPTDTPLIPLLINTKDPLTKQDSHSDSDLDSPCWKGTLPLNRSPSPSPPPDSHYHNAAQHLDIFSPLPTTCGDNSSFSLHTTSSAFEPAFPPVYSITSSPQLKNLSFTHPSCDVRLPLPHKDWSSKERLMTQSNVAGSMTNENATTVFNSDSCKVGILHGPKLDTQKIITAINKLSELLLQNCSTHLDSLNDHELHIIERVISNLTHCVTNKIGQTTLMPDFSHHYMPYSDKNAVDVNKCSIMELLAARTKASRVPHDFR